MTRALKVAILEDEPLARRRLERLVATTPGLVLAGSFDNPLNARAQLEAVDLLFLDIEMPFEDGFSFLDALPAARRPSVIVTTAHGKHAVRAFRHDAVDFLLKPYDEAGFVAAVDRARKRIRAGDLQDSAAQILAALAQADSPPAQQPVQAAPLLGVRVADGTGERVLPPAEIDWIRVEGKTLLVSAGGATHVATGALAAFEQRLAPHGFVRVQRALLLNSARIAGVQRLSHGDRLLTLKDGTQMALSRHYAAAVDALTL